MVKKHASGNVKASTGTSVAAGMIIALILNLMGALICSTLLSNESITEESVYVFLIGIWVFSSFAGALTVSIMSGRNIILIPVTGVVYLLILIGTGLLVFESNLKMLITSFLSIIAGSIPVILMVLNKKPRRYQRKNVYH